MNPLLFLGIILFCYMNFWFLVSIIKKRNDVADVAWGLGFVLLAWISFLQSNEPNVSRQIVTILVTIWGLRLALHISKRHKEGKEDERYAEWRVLWGKWIYLRSYFQIFILQGFFLFLVSIPVLAINLGTGFDSYLLLYLGLFVWIIGFALESISDWQLSNFIKNTENKGKILREGLWGYSRHPNYFGEVTQWWGIWIVSLGTEFYFFTIIGPLTITYLILKVSGIPMLEKKMSLHPDFKKYANEVSVFVPLPPKTRFK